MPRAIAPARLRPFSLLTYDDVRRRAALDRDGDRPAVDAAVEAVNPGTATFSDERRLTDDELARLQQMDRGRCAGRQSAPLCRRCRAVDRRLAARHTGSRRVDAGGVRRAAPTAATCSERSSSRSRSDRARFVRAIEFRPGNARVVHHANSRRRSHTIVACSSTRATRARLRRRHGAGRTLSRRASCSAGRRAGAASGRPTACRGGWNRAAILSCSCICSRPESASTLHASASASFSPMTRRRARRSACDWAARRSTFRRASATIVVRRSLCPAGRRRTCWRFSRTRTTSRGAMRGRPRRCRTARVAPADRASTIGISAGRTSIAMPTPIALPRGRRSAMRYTYDNSAANVRNPHRPPARVVWGQNTTDEMGDLWLQVVPRDGRRLRARSSAGCPPEGARRRSRRVHEAAARPIPTIPLRHDAVARLYFEAGSSTRRSLSTADRCGSIRHRRRRITTSAIALVGARPTGRGDRASFEEALRHRSRLRAGAQQSRRAAPAARPTGRGARITTGARSRCGRTTSRRGRTSRQLLSAPGRPAEARRAVSRRAGA